MTEGSARGPLLVPPHVILTSTVLVCMLLLKVLVPAPTTTAATTSGSLRDSSHDATLSYATLSYSNRRMSGDGSDVCAPAGGLATLNTAAGVLAELLEEVVKPALFDLYRVARAYGAEPCMCLRNGQRVEMLEDEADLSALLKHMSLVLERAVSGTSSYSDVPPEILRQQLDVLRKARNRLMHSCDANKRAAIENGCQIFLAAQFILLSARSIRVRQTDRLNKLNSLLHRFESHSKAPFLQSMIEVSW